MHLDRHIIEKITRLEYAELLHMDMKNHIGLLDYIAHEMGDSGHDDMKLLTHMLWISSSYLDQRAHKLETYIHGEVEKLAEKWRLKDDGHFVHEIAYEDIESVEQLQNLVMEKGALRVMGDDGGFVGIRYDSFDAIAQKLLKTKAKADE